jgi:hypothetical protein
VLNLSVKISQRDSKVTGISIRVEMFDIHKLCLHPKGSLEKCTDYYLDSNSILIRLTRLSISIGLVIKHPTFSPGNSCFNDS